MPDANEVKTWYNQHYAAKGLQSMRPAAAYPVFLDILGARPGTRLLDVSCGAGSHAAAVDVVALRPFSRVGSIQTGAAPTRVHVSRAGRFGVCDQSVCAGSRDSRPASRPAG